MRARACAAAALALLLAACGPGVRGTFEDEAGLSRLAFDGSGGVRQSSPLGGVEQQLRYRVEGDQVRLEHPAVEGAALVLTRVDVDTLAGPGGMRFRRID